MTTAYKISDPKQRQQLRTTRDTLRKARQFIDEGWTKGANSYHGRVCAQGAVSKAVYGNPEGYDPEKRHLVQDALGYVLNVLRDRTHSTMYVTDFNDRQKTKKPVLDLFDDAIKRIDRQLDARKSKGVRIR